LGWPGPGRPAAGGARTRGGGGLSLGWLRNQRPAAAGPRARGSGGPPLGWLGIQRPAAAGPRWAATIWMGSRHLDSRGGSPPVLILLLRRGGGSPRSPLVQAVPLAQPLQNKTTPAPLRREGVSIPRGVEGASLPEGVKGGSISEGGVGVSPRRRPRTWATWALHPSPRLCARGRRRHRDARLPLRHSGARPWRRRWQWATRA